MEEPQTPSEPVPPPASPVLGEAAETLRDTPLAGAMRRPVALAAILVAMLLFAAAVGLLYYRWIGAPQPSAIIRIEGDSRLEGAVATVSGGGLSQSLKLVLNADNNYSGRIYVEPGFYTLTLLQGDRLIYSANFPIDAYHQFTPRLKEMNLPATAPAFDD